MTLTIVVGLGRSGLGAARLLHHQGQKVVVLERGTGPDQTSCAATLQAEGIQVELGIPLEINSFEPWRSDLDAVVVGPGIPWDHPTLNGLRQEGVQIRGEIELAWEALNDIPWVGNHREPTAKPRSPTFSVTC
jgi:UDP-N-acetylmuramoylalanine--D-glutamate ligase